MLAQPFLALPAPALPTVSVGNLAIGGTGKTQVVLSLASRAAGKVAIVTRGYGGSLRAPAIVHGDDSATRCGDEALLLARRLPHCLVIVARDRARGLQLAKDHGCHWVLLDDGLQQTHVAATERIVVFGAEAPIGNGALLPLGPLRDPLAALRPDDLVWLHGEGEGAGLPRVDVRSRTRSLGLVLPAQLDAATEPLKGKRLFAFAGIARPDRFFETLRASGAALCGTARFADHRRFEPRELAALAARAQALNAEALVCTEKDATRIGELTLALPLFALRTELELVSGQDAVAALLARLSQDR